MRNWYLVLLDIGNIQHALLEKMQNMQVLLTFLTSQTLLDIININNYRHLLLIFSASMNPFAALESDDEDDSFTKVQSNKKTGAIILLHILCLFLFSLVFHAVI